MEVMFCSYVLDTFNLVYLYNVDYSRIPADQVHCMVIQTLELHLLGNHKYYN